MNRRAFLMSTAGLAAAPALPVQPGLPETGSAAKPDDFDVWLQGFRLKAQAAGLPADFLAFTLAGLRPEPSIVSQDQRQPEFSKPISSYIAATVSPGRISAGQARRSAASPWLDPLAVRYGVPAEILVAIWGVESGFGQSQGGTDVLRAFATLAAQGRRRDWAEGQLIAALRMLATGEATRGQMKGSWAGAMGQTQFTPEDYLAFAVDGDGDGRRDIWASSPDALASTGNFLKRKAAWRVGESWAREVVVPRQGFDYALVEGPSQTPAQWRSLGVALADPSQPLHVADATETAQLIMPMGWSGPGFLIFPNHHAIRAYNNSVSYALSVGLLADRIAGAGPLVQPWPDDQPIPLGDRIAAQQSLARQGFDPGVVDGVLGAGTRRAAKAWQAARGLPADGYLSYALVQRLKAELAAASVPDLAAPPPAGPAST